MIMGTSTNLLPENLFGELAQGAQHIGRPEK